MLRLDAAAGIRDIHAEGAILLRGCDGCPPTLRGVIERVCHEVSDRTLPEGSIEVGIKVLIGFDGQPDASFRRGGFVELSDQMEFFRDMKPLAEDLRLGTL